MLNKKIMIMLSFQCFPSRSCCRVLPEAEGIEPVQALPFRVPTACEIPQSGVLWNNWSGKWEAWMCLYERSFFLGQFDNSEQAIQIYNAALYNHYHGIVQEPAHALVVVCFDLPTLYQSKPHCQCLIWEDILQDDLFARFG